MEKETLNNFFEDFLNKESLFLNKQALQSNYTPETIPHRESEINQVANILAPCLKLEKPSNLFIYGKTGTGKTLTLKHITKNLNKLSLEKGIPLKTIYLNCKLKKIADTEHPRELIVDVMCAMQDHYGYLSDERLNILGDMRGPEGRAATLEDLRLEARNDNSTRRGGRDSYPGGPTSEWSET